MLEQEFANGHSVIHRLDPRLKVLVAVGFSIVTAVLTKNSALATAACAAVFLAFLARLPIQALVRRLLVVNGFLLFLWLTLPLSFAEAAPIHFGPVGIKPVGFLLALIITIKSNAIVLAGIALLATHPPTDVARALSRLHVPAKLVGILLFMLRYLSEIRREYGWMRNAMTMRTFQPGTNMRTYKAYARLVGLLLVISYEKAEAVHAAMLCRGFTGRFYALDDHPLKLQDLLISAAMTTAILGIAALQWSQFIHLN
jgi:cobalt/nickel transport system permease protein